MKEIYKKIGTVNFKLYTQNINHSIVLGDKVFNDTKNSLKLQETKGRKEIIYRGGKLLLCGDGVGRKNKVELMGKLLGLENDINKTESFFDKTGFLFPISAEEPEVIDFETIFSLINRIKATMKLMELLCDNKPNYNDILNNFMYLMLSKGIDIQFKKFSYKSYNKNFIDIMNNFSQINLANESVVNLGSDTCIEYIVKDSIYKDGFIFDAPRLYYDFFRPDIPNYMNQFTNGEKLFGIIFNSYMQYTLQRKIDCESLNGLDIICEQIHGYTLDEFPEKTPSQILAKILSELPGQCPGEIFTKSSQPQVINTPFTFNEIAKEEITNFKIILDFLFHFQYEVGIVKKCFLNKDLEYLDKPKSEKFNDNMKKALINAAKILVSEEISYNIKNICYYFDSEKQKLLISVNSLLSGLYFTLAQFNPKEERYIKCAREKCNNYILTKKDNTSNRFCSSKCSNAEAQKNYRNRHKNKV